MSNMLSTLLRPSVRETVRAAAELLAQHSGGRGPVVVWQAITETIADFDRRVTGIRAAMPAGAPLIAVQSGKRTAAAPPGVRYAELPPKLFTLLHPSTPTRYRVASGGRGSGKSFGIATALVLLAATQRARVLCCREIQKSIRESVHRLLVDRIDALGLAPYFNVNDYSITSSAGGEFLFEGLWANVSKVKSLEGITHVWIEEAETISDRSLEVLIPTIRAPGSEIWLSLNPDSKDAPVFKRFITRPPPDARHTHVIFSDNAWFPVELERERVYLQSVDADAYAHVWEGACREASDAQILRGKYVVADFTPAVTWAGPYYGADWGFSQDPTTLVKCWINDLTLYVEREAYAVGVDIDRTPALFDQIEGARKRTIRADSARPETISFMQRNGYPNMTPALKWPGSVEDGIAHLRSFRQIVIHPSCVKTAQEAKLYSYRVDRLTGDVLADVVDAHNHCLDALRYALAPLIRNNKMGALVYIEQLKAEAAAAAGSG